MDGNALIAVGLIVIAIGLAIIVQRYRAARKANGKGVVPKRPAATEPKRLTDEGAVARIRTATDEWGTRIHVLLEESPGQPITLAIDAGHPAIPLTKVGDRVRIERNDEEGAEYRFTNLTLGLTVSSED